MKTLIILIWSVTLVAVSAGGGYWFALRQADDAMLPAELEQKRAPASKEEKKVLYWYDPMVPNQHFDQPGKSPFMDMDLVPKYADPDEGVTGVTIDSRIRQNLGIRRAVVVRKSVSRSVDVAGNLIFNQRDVAILQARSSGFVERVYARAPGDVIARHAPLADIFMPEWWGAQIEFLSLRHNGDHELATAARDRLKLLGLPNDLIARIEGTGKPERLVTLNSPIAGVIDLLGVRQGMTIEKGMTLAKIVDIATVWLEADVPETQVSLMQEGLTLQAKLAAFPAECFSGRIITMLPDTNTMTRTVKVRAELQNPEGRLRPGMFAHVTVDTGATKPLLWVPSEAVIRTGQRNVVIVAREKEVFLPVEVDIGEEIQGEIAIIRGLSEGQTVVSSGQFLIDSEASFSGVLQKLESAQQNSEIEDD